LIIEIKNFSILLKKIVLNLEIDWSMGDFDPRECFLLWSYEAPRNKIIHLVIYFK